jgi:aconitase B
MSDFFTEYGKHVEKRAAQGLPLLVLNEAQCLEVVKLLQNPSIQRLCPPTALDSDQLKKEGFFARFAPLGGSEIKMNKCIK